MVEKIKLVFDFWPIVVCPHTGIYFVTCNLLSQLMKREDIDLYLYCHQPLTDEQKNRIKSDLNISISEDKILLPDSDFADKKVFFSALFAPPEFLKKHNIPTFVLLYDMTQVFFPEYFGDNAGARWFTKLCRSFNSERYYFAISECTKRDFIKYFPQLDERRVITTLISTNFAYKPDNDKKKLEEIKVKYNIPKDKKYLFSLCSLQPRKNLIRAVKTFIDFTSKNKITDLVFVLGGGAWAGFVERLEKEVPEYEKYKDKIIRAGYVDDADLEILYSNAEWFVYTSQYEGFGMPPLEAMSCGCPVITSNNSSLPEVVGDAGIMIDWDSDEQHVEAYEKYYSDKTYRKEMAQKGLERSKLFSWQKTVDEMMKSIRSAVWTIPKKVKIILKTEEKYLKLFGFFPLLKIVNRIGKTKYYLFNILPIIKVRRTKFFTKLYIFGILVYKVNIIVKREENGEENKSSV